MEQPEPMAYIARRACGCFAIAVFDAPDDRKSTAKTVADAIRSGYAVERVSEAYVREHYRLSCAACKPPIQEKMRL